MNSSKSEPIVTAPRKARLKVRLTKLVRRIHLYTGLLLLPWVIFFGFSGMLFNHPELGSTEVVARFDGTLADDHGFSRPEAEALAAKVVAALNATEEGNIYRRADEGDAVIEGELSFQGSSPTGPVVLNLNPVDGDAVVTRTPESPKASPPPFQTIAIPGVDGFDKASLQDLATDLLSAGGIETHGPVEPSTRGGAELRFRIESEETGQRWNLAWNLAGGRVNARELGSGNGPDLYTALTRFHKTHHYPSQMGARWLWTALADATGLTMVFWGISGAIMWWQIKPTRVLGVAGLSVAGVIALFVFAGTYSQLHWVPREARPAPAEAKPDSPAPDGKTTSHPRRS